MEDIYRKELKNLVIKAGKKKRGLYLILSRITSVVPRRKTILKIDEKEELKEIRDAIAIDILLNYGRFEGE